MKEHVIDTALWLSRRLRHALLALLAVAVVKTAAAALDEPVPETGAGSPITASAAVVS